MNIFKPTTLLDKFYEVGIAIKGIDGLIELVAGVALLVVSKGTIAHLTSQLTKGELARDPHNFVANHIAHAGAHLAHGQHTFAAIFLLTHGVVKVGLVGALLLKKHWAYPVGIVILGILLLYQLYQLVVTPGIGMALLSVLDAAIIWLIWREWQHVRADQDSAAN